jgi:multisubunit Na+/H+ antiporter MnhF subunit
MAGMSPFLAAAIAFLPPLAVCLALAIYGGLQDRLVALELVAALAAPFALLLAVGFGESYLADLALGFTLLSVPGTLVYAHFTERWR